MIHGHAARTWNGQLLTTEQYSVLGGNGCSFELKFHCLYLAVKTERLWEHTGKEAHEKRDSYSTTEFPIPLCVRFCYVLFWALPCPAWAVASCSSGPQAGGTP